MMDSGQIHQIIASFKSGFVEKASKWDSLLTAREEDLQTLKGKGEALQLRQSHEQERILSLQNCINNLESQKQDQLELEGVCKRLQDLHARMQELKAQQQPQTTIFPECSVCFEVCDPGQSRLVYCCPDGHTICGDCSEKLTRCPTCRRETSTFGGKFTRVREFENLSGKACPSGSSMDVIERMSELVVERKPLEYRKKTIIDHFEGMKLPLQQELSEAQNQVSALEENIQSLRDVYESAKAELISFVEELKKGMSQLNSMAQQIQRRHDAFYEASSGINDALERFKYLATCSCDLACPHPLLIGIDERILGDPCGCLNLKPCTCATHSVTLHLTIEGSQTGLIKILLAGRSNPNAVNRFYGAAKADLYAGSIIDQVQKHKCLTGGQYERDGKGRKVVFIHKDDAGQLDSMEKHFLGSKPYSVGFSDLANDLGRASFKIYLGGGQSPDYRTVGVVSEGYDFIHKINELAVRLRRFSPYDTKMMPKQEVAIVKSTGEVLKHNLSF